MAEQPVVNSSNDDEDSISDDDDVSEIDDDSDVKDFLSAAEASLVPGVQWDDVVGIQHAKKVVKEMVVLPVKFPQLFKGSRNPFTLGVLLYGPPGTGKTLLVRAAIAEMKLCNALVYNISAYDLLSKYLKDPVKVVRAMFRNARRYETSVLFIDDIEALSLQSSGESELTRNLKMTFMQEAISILWRFDSYLSIVGVTNKPWQLVGLKSLLHLRVHVRLPDNQARCAIFQKELASTPHCLTVDQFIELGKMSEGFTGADIVIAGRDACMQPVRKIQAATHFRKVSGPSEEDPNKLVDDLLTPCSADDPGAMEMDWSQADKLFTPKLTMDDMMSSLSTVKPSVSQQDLQMYKTFEEDRGTH